MTRNLLADRRAAVNSRFSSNRTNKRFLLRVSCGRRKTRLCTVEDGGFPQQRERGPPHESARECLAFPSIRRGQKITRLIARLPACPRRPRQSPFSDDCPLYFVVIFFLKESRWRDPSKTGANHRAFLLVSFRFAEAWTRREALRFGIPLKIPMGVHVVLIGNRGNYTG